MEKNLQTTHQKDSRDNDLSPARHLQPQNNLKGKHKNGDVQDYLDDPNYQREQIKIQALFPSVPRGVPEQVDGDAYAQVRHLGGDEPHRRRDHQIETRPAEVVDREDAAVEHAHGQLGQEEGQVEDRLANEEGLAVQPARAARQLCTYGSPSARQSP